MPPYPRPFYTDDGDLPDVTYYIRERSERARTCEYLVDVPFKSGGTFKEESAR